MSEGIEYRTILDGVDWAALKASYAADRFDNGRTPEQLRRSFENSSAAILAVAAGRVVGTARVLSDGVCNAYVVDVWTLSSFRRRGVARRMMETLLEGLQGHHVGLFTEHAAEFYRSLGFEEEQIGMSRVIGRWLMDRRPSRH